MANDQTDIPKKKNVAFATVKGVFIGALAAVGVVGAIAGVEAVSANVSGDKAAFSNLSSKIKTDLKDQKYGMGVGVAIGFLGLEVTQPL